MRNRARASAVCVHENRLLLVRLEDPLTKKNYLFPPGGKIEKGESALECAERETMEETGYTVKGDPTSERICKYPFFWGGLVYQCVTHFFKAALLPVPARRISDVSYHRGLEWIALDQVAETFAYHLLLKEVVTQLTLSI